LVGCVLAQVWLTKMARCYSVEYGGRVRTFEIEGVQTALVENNQFRAFDLNVQRKGHASATLIGRYFSGEKQWSHRGTEFLWGGFGHTGMYSLLVVQEVTCVRSGPLHPFNKC
jgi:hypothetical protein